MEKGQNAGNQHFLLFPQFFPSYQTQILSLGKELLCHLTTLKIQTNLKFDRIAKGQRAVLVFLFTFNTTDTVKPVLKTTCIKRPPTLRDHCSDTATILKSTD